MTVVFPLFHLYMATDHTKPTPQGMASPLMGIAAVNSLLFTAYGVSKRIISPYPDLSLGQIAAAGGLAGAANAVLASPVRVSL